MCCFMYMFRSAAQNDITYLDPPKYIVKPSESFLNSHKIDNRRFTGISSIAVTGKGRMFAVWYAGITPREDFNNYVVVAQSDDQGNTWREILIIDPDLDGPIRAFDPEVWIDPTGKLWVTWSQITNVLGQSLYSYKSKIGVWAMRVDNPDAQKIKWGEPKRFVDGVMMCKPMILSTGEWVFPVTNWGEAYKTEMTCQMYVSTDEGKTWELRGAARVPKETRGFEENMIVEKKDGTLWMVGRRKNGLNMGECYSSDRGKTWTDLDSAKDIRHTTSRIFIYTLKSGNLLLVKHAEIDEILKVGRGRSHLKAFISRDDGNTWSKGLLLDERVGISYPDGQEYNGRIYITWDFSRRKEQQILMTSFTEEDIFSEDREEAQRKTMKNRRIISIGGKHVK